MVIGATHAQMRHPKAGVTSHGSHEPDRDSSSTVSSTAMKRSGGATTLSLLTIALSMTFDIEARQCGPAGARLMRRVNPTPAPEQGTRSKFRPPKIL